MIWTTFFLIGLAFVFAVIGWIRWDDSDDME
jgi:hypothetical protein